MATRRICDFLKGSGAAYSLHTHAPAFTAQEVAAAAHVPGRLMAKNVIVWMDGQLAMAVIPATHELDLNLLQTQSGATLVRLASEAEFLRAFVGSQLGSAPPFGILFGVRTFADVKLALRDEIAFNAGTHTEIVQMKFADYRRLVNPVMLPMSAAPAPHVHTTVDETAESLQTQCSCEMVHHLGAD